MDGAKRETSTVPSLPPPLPKSPPPYPDLYGKRRELARVQMLEREIGFLEVLYFLYSTLVCLQISICSRKSRNEPESNPEPVMSLDGYPIMLGSLDF